MFDFLKPCVDCPFKRENGPKFGLHPDRLAEIFDGPAFECHKTTGISGPKRKPQQCAGAMSVLHKEGKPNQIMQVADRMVWFDAAKIDGSETYDSIADCIEGHNPC